MLESISQPMPMGNPFGNCHIRISAPITYIDIQITF